MIQSKKELGECLREELAKGYNIGRISSWAYDACINMRNNPSPQLEDVMQSLFMMDAGPEFEYTEKELTLLAELLINNEEDPIKTIQKLSDEGAL